MYKLMNERTYVRMYVHVQMCDANVCMCANVCMHVCMCECMNV